MFAPPHPPDPAGKDIVFQFVSRSHLCKRNRCSLFRPPARGSSTSQSLLPLAPTALFIPRALCSSQPTPHKLCSEFRVQSLNSEQSALLLPLLPNLPLIVFVPVPTRHLDMRPSNVSVICCVLAGWVTGSAAQAGVIAQPGAALTSSGRALQSPPPPSPPPPLPTIISNPCWKVHTRSIVL